PSERSTPRTPRRRPAAGGVGSAGTVRACLSAGTPAPGGVEIDDIALAVLPALGSGVRIGGGGDRPPAGLALEFRPQDGLGRCGVEDVAGFRRPGPARTRARLLGHAPWTARQPGDLRRVVACSWGLHSIHYRARRTVRAATAPCVGVSTGPGQS